ncbi:MAG: hypothetical protein EAZ99_10830 [Alphaproteobacteria bacterium]|nr:MAG: hypothetical protein EAZ99_10830 [Alphaproteobacteria bacterium]
MRGTITDALVNEVAMPGALNLSTLDSIQLNSSFAGAAKRVLPSYLNPIETGKLPRSFEANKAFAARALVISGSTGILSPITI